MVCPATSFLGNIRLSSAERYLLSLIQKLLIVRFAEKFLGSRIIRNEAGYEIPSP